MTVYVIHRNEDCTQWQLTTPKNIRKSPHLGQDVDGRSMLLVKRFKARSYKKAKVIYEKVMSEVRDRECYWRGARVW